MKFKLRNVLLSFLLIFSVTCFSACKKKQEEQPSLTNPIVNAIVENREFYVGEKLSDVLISLTEGDTAGSIAWVNPDHVFVLGENVVSWKFTPTDTSVFKSKTGSVTLEAVAPKLAPTINVSVVSEKAYAENKLSSVLLGLAEGNTAGTVVWRTPDVVLEVGTKEFEWKFTPTDTETYNEIIGKVSVEVVKRLPRYYRYLKALIDEGIVRISSQALGKKMNVTARQAAF